MIYRVWNIVDRLIILDIDWNIVDIALIWYFPHSEMLKTDDVCKLNENRSQLQQIYIILDLSSTIETDSEIQQIQVKYSLI